MNAKISHNRDDESIEAKVEWFRSLSIEERMDLLCCFTDLALALNPGIMEKKMINRLIDVFASFQKHDVKYLAYQK
jgi:hypothetical protein